MLEHKSSPPSEDDLSPPHGELSHGESPAAPTTVQVAAWRAVPIVASRIKDLSSAAFLSDDDSDHFSRLSTDSASSPSETSSDVDAAASWRAADAKEEEHAALVGALRQQIAQLTASLEEERAAKLGPGRPVNIRLCEEQAKAPQGAASKAKHGPPL